MMEENYRLKADIVIAVGLWGGMENAINRTGKYLIENNVELRVVQCVWQGYNWIEPMIPFFCLDVDNSGVSVETLADAYEFFLRENGCPDLVIATGLPFMNTVVNISRENLEAKYRIIAWPHSSIQSYIEEGMGDLSNFADADYGFAINDEIKKHLDDVLLEEDVYRIKNGFDSDIIVFNDKRETSQFAYVGRLDANKNILGVLHVLSRCMDLDWRFHVVGDGPLADELMVFVREHQMENRVLFYGWQKNPWEVLKSCKTLIFSTKGREAAPLVLLEALASGLMLFSTKRGNAEEVVNEGENGYFFETEEELESLIRKQLKSKLYLPTEDACRESAQSFSPENVLKEFYDTLLAVTTYDMLRRLLFCRFDQMIPMCSKFV